MGHLEGDGDPCVFFFLSNYHCNGVWGPDYCTGTEYMEEEGFGGLLLGTCNFSAKTLI